MEINEMGASISSDVIAGAVLLMLIWLVGKLSPLVRRYTGAWWRRVAACCTAHWRKLVIALTVTWGVGGFLAYAMAGGMTDTAPL